MDMIEVFLAGMLVGQIVMPLIRRCLRCVLDESRKVAQEFEKAEDKPLKEM